MQILTSGTTVTSVQYDQTLPHSIEIKGTVDSQSYFPVDVYFEHCLPAAFVACNTYPSPVTSISNSTEMVGNVTYSFYVGNYSVMVPNNETYGVSVRLGTSNHNGTYLTALAVLPLFAVTPLIGNYNIDCFFPSSNFSISNIACASA